MRDGGARRATATVKDGGWTVGQAAGCAALTRNIVECLYVHELADVLSQSEDGREALRYKLFTAVSVEYLKFAMSWARSVSAEGRLTAVSRWR